MVFFSKKVGALIGLLLLATLLLSACGDILTHDSAQNDVDISYSGLAWAGKDKPILRGPERAELAFCGPLKTVEGSQSLDWLLVNTVMCESATNSYNKIRTYLEKNGTYTKELHEKQVLEALKAQAVAARSWLRGKLGEYKNYHNVTIQTGQHWQVYQCTYRNEQPVRALVERAVKETQNEVMVYSHPKFKDQTFNIGVVYGFYVDGDVFDVALAQRGCHEKKYVRVTYNEGKVSWAEKVRAGAHTASKMADPKHPLNHGVMAQHGSACLATVKNYDYHRILKFYYGEIQFYRSPACPDDDGYASSGHVGSDSEPVAGPGEEVPTPSPYDPPIGSDGKPVGEPSEPVHDDEALSNCSAGPGSPNIYDRNDWGAATPRGTSRLQHPKRFFITHTASEGSGAAAVKSIQDHHFKKGWSDIGYHYIIDSSGAVYKGRDDQREGVFQRGKNKDTIGIALIGTFSSSEPSQEQSRALAATLKSLGSSFGIPVDTSHVEIRSGVPSGVSSQATKAMKMASGKLVCDTKAVADSKRDPDAPSINGPKITIPEIATIYKRRFNQIKLVGKAGTFTLDTIFISTPGIGIGGFGSKTIYADGAGKLSSSCGEIEGKRLSITNGSTKIFKFSENFGNSDKIEIVRQNLGSSSNCEYARKDGRVEVYVKGDSTGWIKVGGQIDSNASYSKFDDNFKDLEPGIQSPLDFVKKISSFLSKGLDKLKNGIKIGKYLTIKIDPIKGVASLDVLVDGKFKATVNASKDGSFDSQIDFKAFGRKNVVVLAKDENGNYIGKFNSQVEIGDGDGFSTPQNGATYGPNINLEVNVDPNKVATVKYKVDGKLVGEGTKDNNYRVNYDFNNHGEDGKHTATVVAEKYNSKGEMIGSSEVQINVNKDGKAGGLAITTPAPSSTISGDQQTFKVDANDTGITNVEYYVNKKKVGESTDRNGGFPVTAKDLPKGKTVTVETVGKNESGKVVARQSAEYNVPDEDGVVSQDQNASSEVTTGTSFSRDTNLANSLAEQGGKAWIAGNYCNSSYQRNFFKNGFKLGGRTSMEAGFSRCKSPAYKTSSCGGSLGYCYMAVKGALYRGLSGDPNGNICRTHNATSGKIINFVTDGSNYVGSAAKLHKLALLNPTKFAQSFGLLENTSLKSTRQAKKGDLIVWDAGCSYLYNSGKLGHASSQHGHIEVIVDDAGMACSDFCHLVNRPVAGQKCWHVYEPVRPMSW